MQTILTTTSRFLFCIGSQRYGLQLLYSLLANVWMCASPMLYLIHENIFIFAGGQILPAVKDESEKQPSLHSRYFARYLHATQTDFTKASSFYYYIYWARSHFWEKSCLFATWIVQSCLKKHYCNLANMHQIHGSIWWMLLQDALLTLFLWTMILAYFY